MDKLIELSGTFTALIALTGAVVALFQYHQAQKWKRLEFAANQLERLSRDPVLDLALTFLDWEEGKLVLPDNLGHLADSHEDGIHTFRHQKQRLIAALSPNPQKDAELNVYRVVFEHLFDYFEQVEKFIRLKVIREKEVMNGLEFWIKKISPSKDKTDDTSVSIFYQYLVDNQYDEVQKLISRLERNKK
jgi:hypothetical protein